MKGGKTFFTISVDKIKPVFMHVLIVSNNNENIEWINNPLQATGLSINLIYANSVKEAVLLIQSVKFDMILYDLSFSETGMADNFKRLYASGTKVPLVVLTETIGDPQAGEAMEFGAVSHVVKDRLQVSVMAESLKNILLQKEIIYN